MERMRQPPLHGAAARPHRLADHLATESPLPARLRAVAAKQVHLELLEVEDGDQVDQAFGHEALSLGSPAISPSFRDAPLGAGPESITTIRSMDSGLVLRTPRNDGG